MLLTVNLVCMMLHFEIIVKMRMCKIYLIFVVVLSNCFSVCWMFKMNDDTTERMQIISKSLPFQDFASLLELLRISISGLVYN